MSSAVERPKSSTMPEFECPGQERWVGLDAASLCALAPSQGTVVARVSIEVSISDHQSSDGFPQPVGLRQLRHGDVAVEQLGLALPCDRDGRGASRRAGELP